MKWFKRIGLAFLLLLVLIVALIAYVALTDGGLQRTLSLGKNFLPEGVSIGETSGKLTGPASFSDIQFENEDGMQVSVDSVDYDWQPKQVLSGKLQVDRLNVSGVTLRIPEAETSEDTEPKEPFQLSDLKIPLAVEAKDISVTDIAIYPPGADDPIIIDEVLLNAGGEDDELQLLNFSVKAPLGYLKLDGSVNTSGDWPLSLDSEWQFDHEQFGSTRGAGKIEGDLKKLNVQHEVSGLVLSLIHI